MRDKYLAGSRARIAAATPSGPSLMSRIKARLWITRSEGEIWPRGYGLVSRYYRADGTARGTIIPFNLLVGWSIYLYWKIRFGWAAPPSWHDVQAAYADAVERGYEKGWTAGHVEGHEAGWAARIVVPRGD